MGGTPEPASSGTPNKVRIVVRAIAFQFRSETGIVTVMMARDQHPRGFMRTIAKK
jgi:hypothetical protein